MTDFFYKKHIFLKVIASILALFIADTAILLLLGKKVEGEVIKMELNPGGYKSPPINYPVISFTAGSKQYKFKGNWDSYYKPGESVKVVYPPWWPQKAKVYSFWGVMKRPLILLIICLAIWSLLYSSFRQKSRHSGFRRKIKNTSSG